MNAALQILLMRQGPVIVAATTTVTANAGLRPKLEANAGVKPQLESKSGLRV